MPHAQLEARGLARTPPRRPQYVGPVITGSARIAAARRRMSGSCVSNLSRQTDVDEKCACFVKNRVVEVKWFEI
jgi:hypothetical protein